VRRARSAARSGCGRPRRWSTRPGSCRPRTSSSAASPPAERARRSGRDSCQVAFWAGSVPPVVTEPAQFGAGLPLGTWTDVGHFWGAPWWQRPASGAGPGRRRLGMDCKLELIALPVSDVDRAIGFYVDQLGWHLDHDHTVTDDLRFVQVTPPGSG